MLHEANSGLDFRPMLISAHSHGDEAGAIVDAIAAMLARACERQGWQRLPVTREERLCVAVDGSEYLRRATSLCLIVVCGRGSDGVEESFDSLVLADDSREVPIEGFGYLAGVQTQQ